MIADGLSRDTPLLTEWTLHPEVFSVLRLLFPGMEVDLFATRHTTRLPNYVSPLPDPQAQGVDAFTDSGQGRDLYAFPSMCLVPQVLHRLETCTCVMTLIAPLQWRRPWVTSLAHRLLQRPLRLPLRDDLLLRPGSSLRFPGPSRTQPSCLSFVRRVLTTGDTHTEWWTESWPLDELLP